MKLLAIKDYYKAMKALGEVDFNHYFAKAVLLQHISGKVFVDNIEHPSAFYIYHPYGMGLVLGDSTNAEFISGFREYCKNIDKKRTTTDWVQVYPFEWNKIMDELSALLPAIEHYERVNFKFNAEKYNAFRKTLDLNNQNLLETNTEIFEQMEGTVVPRFFWNNATDFLANSKGFSLIVNKQVVSTAFASFRIENILEIGIQTIQGMQGNGYSAVTCCRLIDECMAMRLEPVWSCRKDNVGSVKLAMKLGFEISRVGSYYKIGL